MSTLTKSLTAAQSARKAELETIITEGLASYQKAGEALKAIRDEELYLDDHDTFEDYCQERWGFTARLGYQLIDASETANRCEQVVRIPNEATAREIAKLEPKEQVKVAKELAKSGKRLNSTTAKREVEKRRGRGGLAGLKDQAIDIETVSVQESSALSDEAKAEVIKRIDQWWAEEKIHHNQPPCTIPSRIVELIKRLFQ